MTNYDLLTLYFFSNGSSVGNVFLDDQSPAILEHIVEVFSTLIFLARNILNPCTELIGFFLIRRIEDFPNLLVPVFKLGDRVDESIQ